MRLLYVTNSLELGGAEASLVRLTRALVARGHEIAVVSAGGTLVDDLEKAGGRHYLAPVKLGPRNLLRSAFLLRSLVRQLRPDAIHALSPAGNLATQLLGRGGRPAVVSSPMGLQASEEEPGWVTLVRNAMLVARADRVLVISEEIARSLAPLRLSASRLAHCNVNGIDFSEFPEADLRDAAALRTALGVEGGGPLVVTIGALHARKSHELFVRAAAIVHRSHPLARFVIVGEGHERAGLISLIEREGLRGVLTMTGARRDIPRVLSAANVYVKPGVVEGFVGLTVLEAMAAHVPVVAFDTRDVRAAIQPDATGLLAPRGDVQGLAAAIRELLEDPVKGRALADRARQHVLKHFALEVVAAGVERVYADLLMDR